MSLAPRMRKVVLSDLAGSVLTRFELPETTSVADVEKLFAHESPHFNDAGFMIGDRSSGLLLGRNETLGIFVPCLNASLDALLQCLYLARHRQDGAPSGFLFGKRGLHVFLHVLSERFPVRIIFCTTWSQNPAQHEHILRPLDHLFHDLLHKRLDILVGQFWSLKRGTHLLVHSGTCPGPAGPWVTRCLDFPQQGRLLPQSHFPFLPNHIGLFSCRVIFLIDL